MSSNYLRTLSLTAEPLRLDHLSFLVSLHSDATTMATNGGIRTPQQTEQYLEINQRHWREHGFGLWIFRDPATGEPVGRGGPRYVILEGRREVEVAYTVQACFWGRGYATEMGRLSLDVAAKRGLGNLVAFTLPENKQSRRVTEKIGFMYDREILHLGLTMVLYRRNGESRP
jgi:ribosomal-protein-alanine N-acetyltransferase